MPLFSKKYRPTLLCGLVIVLFGFNSCLKDIPENSSDIGWQPSLAVPLLNGTLTFVDLLSKTDTGNLKTYAGDSLKLVYLNDFVTDSVNKLITLPNQAVSDSFSFPDQNAINAYHFAGTISTNVNTNVPFTPSQGAQIKHIEFQKGTITLNFSSDFKDDVDITLTAPELKKSGTPFSTSLSLKYSETGQTPITKSVSIDLSGYSLDLTKGTQGYNEFAISATVKLKYLGHGTSLQDKIRMNLNANNLKFSYLDGYLSQLPINFKRDSVVINLFKQSVGGGIGFVDPKVTLFVSNTYGIPSRATFTHLDAVYRDGSSFKVANIVEDVNYPTDRNAPPAYTTFAINKDNSDIVPAMSNSPQYFLYGADILANPNGNTTLNFVTSESKLAIHVVTEIPITGNTSYFALQDTFPGPTPQFRESIDKFEYVDFKFVTKNSFPASLYLQLYFTNDKYKLLDSLIVPADNIIAAATTIDGKNVIPTEKTVYARLNKQRLVKIKDSKYIMVRAVLNTKKADGSMPPVTFYSTSKVLLYLGAITKIKP